MKNQQVKKPGTLEQLRDGIPNPRRARVCVIGAGSSGLVALKELREQGHYAYCYEKAGSIGGVFAPGARSENDTTAHAYDELEMNVSNHFMAFSAFPRHEESKRYWSAAEYARYLHDYAEHFRLFDHLRLHTEVLSARRREDGKWLVHSTCQGVQQSEVFDALVVGSGRYHNPRLPQVAGMENFNGQILHSSRYKSAADFAGKRVVIVGLGESGADIARQLAPVAASTHILVRRPPHITHRNLLPHTGKDDTHDALFSPFIFALEDYRYDDINAQTLLRNQAHTFLAGMIPNIRDREARLVREWEDMNGGFPGGPLVNSDGFLQYLVDGRLHINFFGLQSLGADHVLAGDDSKIEADVLIFCTGYEDRFPFLPDNAAVRAAEENPRCLFKHILHPDLGTSLAFIGMVRPIAGGVSMLAELQARYYSAVLAGKLPLPGEEIKEWIAADARREQAYFYVAPEDKNLVVLHEYALWLAREIGCLPKRSYWWRHPRLGLRYFFTSTSGNFFRLCGPGAQAEQAQAAIMRQQLPMNGVGVLIFFILIAKTRTEYWLNRLFGQFLTRKIAARPRQPLHSYLQRFFPAISLQPDSVLRLACENALAWSNLRYRLSQYYQVPGSALHPDLTLQQLQALLAGTNPEK